MINWIRNKLHNFIFPDNSNELVAETRSNRKHPRIQRGQELSSRGMTFTIHMANGGYVLEYSTYDEKTDRTNHSLHIIPSEQDMGQGIAHIITLEMLRK